MTPSSPEARELRACLRAYLAEEAAALRLRRNAYLDLAERLMDAGVARTSNGEFCMPGGRAIADYVASSVRTLAPHLFHREEASASADAIAPAGRTRPNLSDPVKRLAYANGDTPPTL